MKITNKDRWYLVDLLSLLRYKITLGKSRSYMSIYQKSVDDAVFEAFKRLKYRELTNEML